jgi:hypothetical protein
LQGVVRDFVRDFGAVTARWIAQGHHSAAEVAEWRRVISADMSSEVGVDAAIDGRPRDERVRAWCRTFRQLAKKLGV